MRYNKFCNQCGTQVKYLHGVGRWCRKCYLKRQMNVPHGAKIVMRYRDQSNSHRKKIKQLNKALSLFNQEILDLKAKLESAVIENMALKSRLENLRPICPSLIDLATSSQWI